MLALVTGGTGLMGALIGAFASTRIERQRQNRRGIALRYSIRGDVVRWRNVCMAAADWRATGHLGNALRWREFGGELQLHVSLGLYVLAFALYTEREATEQIYAEGLSRNGISDPQAAFEARFALLRWAALADCFIERLDEYEGRSWFKRAGHWLRTPLLARDGGSIEQAMTLIYRNVAASLRSEYGYDVEDDGSLASAVIRGERHKAANDEFLARFRPNGDE